MINCTHVVGFINVQIIKSEYPPLTGCWRDVKFFVWHVVTTNCIENESPKENYQKKKKKSRANTYFFQDLLDVLSGVPG